MIIHQPGVSLIRMVVSTNRGNSKQIKSSIVAAFLCFRMRLYTSGANRAIRGLFGLLMGVWLHDQIVAARVIFIKNKKVF